MLQLVSGRAVRSMIWGPEAKVVELDQPSRSFWRLWLELDTVQSVIWARFCMSRQHNALD